jgi:DNA-binding NarL/FixJ family response regulator
MAAETQPLMVEGLRAILESSSRYYLSDTVQSLEAFVRMAVTASPRIAILDKSFGLPAIIDALARMRGRSGAAVVVWGATITDAEALRLLKAGALGVIRKTANAPALLACLDSVASGSTWMEDALFQNSSRTESGTRSDLTMREQQVLELVEQGMRNKDIARELGIQPGTVKIHLKHIFEKTGVRGRFGLALSGLRERESAYRLSA